MASGRKKGNASTELHHFRCTNLASDIARMKTIVSTVEQQKLDFALQHAIAKGHDLCIEFLFPYTTLDMASLLNSAVKHKQSISLRTVLNLGRCTQQDIDTVLDKLFPWIDVVTLGTFIKHGFQWENFDVLLQEENCDIPIYRYTTMANKFAGASAQLALILLSGGIVDHNQIPMPLSWRHRFKVSLIHRLAHIDKPFYWDPKKKYVYNHDALLKQWKESFHIAHQCGSNLWELDYHEMTPLFHLEIRHKRNVTGELDLTVLPELRIYLKELMSKPLDLKSQCRLALMRHYRSQYLKFVEQFTTVNLPVPVLQFLRGFDLSPDLRTYWLDLMKSKSDSLKSMCRLALMQHFDSRYSKYVKQLSTSEVPATLLQYLGEFES